MKAVLIHPDSHSELVETPSPLTSPAGALVQTVGCGVCGTDLLKINLRLLKHKTVLGHEYVGRIVALGPQANGFAIGDLVVAAHHVPCFECHYCRHGNVSMCDTFKHTNFEPGGFAEYVHLSDLHLQHATFRIPDHMPWDEAIFTEPLACCVRNVNQLGLQRGDAVIIMGLGSIGLMMSALLNRQGIRVFGVDLDAERALISKDFGTTAAFTDTAGALQHAVKEATEGRGADAVIFTAGPASLLNQSLTWLRAGGVINLFSHLSGEMGTIDTAEVYHRELKLIATYSSSTESLKEAFEILKTDALRLRRLFAPIYPPEAFDQAIADVNARKVFKALIRFKAPD